MKYGDELDRMPPDGGVSRRQFLAAGRLTAARLAAGHMLPGGRRRPTDTPTDLADSRDEEPPDAAPR
jgi:hypothetical protein